MLAFNACLLLFDKCRSLTGHPSPVELLWLKVDADEVFQPDFSARKSRPGVGRRHNHDGQRDQADHRKNNLFRENEKNIEFKFLEFLASR